MMTRVFETFAERPRVVIARPGNQNSVFVFDEFGGDPYDLFGCFAFAEDHLGKATTQPAVGVHLGKAQVDDRSGLKSSQYLFASQRARAKSFKQFNGLGCGHAPQPATV
jgi:hypothetical protein